MASGDDPLANMQNLLGYAGLVGANPYLPSGGPDPNVPGGGIPKIPLAGYYTGYNSTAVLPGGSGYMPPTNAQGQEIPGYETEQTAANNLYQQQLAAYNAAQPPPGTTINSVPQANPNAALMQYVQQQNANLQGSPSSLNQGGFGSGNNVASNSAQMQIQSNAQMLDQLKRQGGAVGGQPAAPAPVGPPPPTPPNMRQIYLDALANPGPVRQYGAAPPQAGQTPTGTPGPNVMQAFLAANAGKNTPFINTLKGIQGVA